MVLNHASLRVDHRQRGDIAGWLVGLAQGMAQLVQRNVVATALRMVRAPSEIYFAEGYSLFDGYASLRDGGHREEFLFFVRLASKLPMLQDVAADIEKRFLGCESLKLPPDEGEPLLLCAIADWISISFPSHAGWDRSRLGVSFMELRRDGSFEETAEDIDNVARRSHAETIVEQHVHRAIAGSDPVALWANRNEVFPNLVFGPGVEMNLISAAGLFPVIVRKLLLIAQSADEWLVAGGSAPDWKTKVTRESLTVRNDPDRIAERRFPSQTGGMRTFEWHARFGNNGRIHLHFDAAIREIEVGYIGPHLR